MNRLLILNGGADTGGCGYALKRAFDRHAPGWEARAICRSQVYLRYPTDIVWHRASSITHEVQELVRQADVVHIMDSERPLRWFDLKGKTVVVQHLGSHFRRNRQGVYRACSRAGALQVTDSLDLVQPGVTFEPVAGDFDALAQIRRDEFRYSDRVRIAHAPTNRSKKATAHIVRAVRHLQRRYPIDFDLIERVNNDECLRRKARADIFVDQLTYGFGMNAIECWAMGIPVVSGWAEAKYRRRSLEMFGELPWADATANTLQSVIENLINDKHERAELGRRGNAHGLAWHSEPAVVQRMLALYGAAREVAA